MDNNQENSSMLKAALDRTVGGALSIFEYLLAVGTIAALILNMQPQTKPISTLAAVAIAMIATVPLLTAIHFWMEWERRQKKKDR